ncbi:putative E3 [Human mastadenovirus D]|uniref:Putative E3 n=1 Tax=Human mastadenovirus D TaxID=130310 RepID=X4YFT4_9ADEN|nr:putative E3 [Human mastadenovirus D]
MNTLTSVVLLSLLVAFSQAGIINLNVSWGMNLTLVGPSDLPVTWYDGKGMQFCDGNTIKNPQIKHSCNQQNLTLLNADKSHERTYLGYRHDSKGKVDYKVTVIPPPPATRKPLSEPHYVTVTMGDNITLVGPSDLPVTWYDGEGNKFCDGEKVEHAEFNHTCNIQNLTLLFVNLTHNGAYIGYNKDGSDRELYEVSVKTLFQNGAGQSKVEQGNKGKPNTAQSGGKKTKTEHRNQSPKRKSTNNLQPTQLYVRPFTNVSLTGPPNGKVTWYDGELNDPCEQKYKLRTFCNQQNLTLINVSSTYDGIYYGTDEKDKANRYRIKVNTTNHKTVKIKPHTRKPPAVQEKQFELQDAETDENESKIPSATVAIVVGVIAGFVTLIIVFICYICCRKRPRSYNHMVDPLLSFSY